MKTLTVVDSKVYFYIVLYKNQHDGNSPSIRDIIKAGLTRSTSHTQFVLKKLEGFGYIKRLPGVSRSIQILPMPEDIIQVTVRKEE